MLSDYIYCCIFCCTNT